LDNNAYVIAGYSIVCASIGAYVVSLFARGRRARARTELIAAKASKHHGSS